MMLSAKPGRSRPVAGNPLPSSSISFGMTLVMAIACGVTAANIYYNQPMLGIMEAAFPGQVTVIGLVPTATQLGFAAGLLLLVPLGDRFDRRCLILLQLAALALSLAAAALAPYAWSLVVASALVGATSSVTQQIVPFASELAEPSRRLRSVLREHIDNFGVTAAVTILQPHHRQRREKWHTRLAVTVKTARKKYRLFGNTDEFVLGGANASAAG